MEHKKREYHASIDIHPNKGIIYRASSDILSPKNPNAFVRTTYELSEDGKSYIKESSEIEPRLGFENPKNVHQTNISIEEFKKEMTDFVLKNKEKFIVEVSTCGKETSYKEFCQSLEKSELLLHTRGLAEHGATHSQSHNNNHAYNNSNKKVKVKD